MMFLEHIFVAVVFGLIAAIVFVFGVVAAQIVDIDHVFNSASDITFFQKFNRALDSLSYVNSDGYFAESSRGLYRGFFHRPVVFFSFVFIVISGVGFAFGWFIHLISDGIVLFEWDGF